jgi:hypothetical protein
LANPCHLPETREEVTSDITLGPSPTALGKFPKVSSLHYPERANHAMTISAAQSNEMMYRRENIDRKIIDLQRMLATTDDLLTLALLNMAIESFLSERDTLLLVGNQRAADTAQGTDEAEPFNEAPQPSRLGWKEISTDPMTSTVTS